MQTKENVKTIEVNGETMTLKFGKLAPRAESAVLAQMGETVVLAVTSISKDNAELDYFPLTVEYVERFYAGGIISGSRFLKREMRPSETSVLKARQIDHSIRSLFPKSFKKQVDVIITVLSYDEVHDPEILAVNSASMALMLSSIPFAGPSASVRVGVKGSELLVNSGNDIEETLDGEFVVSVREDRVLNIEGWGDQLSEETMGAVMDKAVEACQPILKAQIEIAKEFGKTKMEYAESPAPEDLIAKVKKEYADRITAALFDKEARQELMAGIKAELAEGDEPPATMDIDTAVEYVARRIMRDGVLAAEKRTSGRKLDEIRDLEIEIGLLPRVHGSALFRRGKTQSLSIVTLGSTRLVQTLESYEGESEKSFMHHYNGPHYSMGEAGRFAYYPGRREIGHGHLTENALHKIMPSVEDFPYTTRVVSEILSQQGSSSMAATCATSLALMQAGVPLKATVGGISVGLVTKDDDLASFKLLTDIEDVEDFYGDMDFKVTGTKKGVTAIQMDNKLMGVPVTILKAAFQASKKAREQIIAAMEDVISEPNKEMSKYAPRVTVIKISPEKIGELIGPGGKNIKAIVEKAGEGVDIDIKEDGSVFITATSPEGASIAEQLVNECTMVAEVGKTYTGVVDKVMPYGAFVDVSSSISGLLHVSEMSDKFVKDPGTIVKEGQTVVVKVIKIDEAGKVSFSMKGVAQNV
jgi:polyribonucleotide nucleotidyltransferase